MFCLIFFFCSLTCLILLCCLRICHKTQSYEYFLQFCIVVTSCCFVFHPFISFSFSAQHNAAWVLYTLFSFYVEVRYIFYLIYESQLEFQYVCFYFLKFCIHFFRSLQRRFLSFVFSAHVSLVGRS